MRRDEGDKDEDSEQPQLSSNKKMNSDELHRVEQGH